MLLFDYKDYRPYLRDYQKNLPKNGWGFISKLSKHLGVSQVHVSQVLQGSKDFSLEQAILVCDFISLNEVETEFFLMLVIHDKSGNFKLKDFAEKKIRRIKDQGTTVKNQLKDHTEVSESMKAQFYSSFVYSAVRQYVFILEQRNGGAQFGELKEKFHITNSELKKILDFLVVAQMLQFDGFKYRLGIARTFLGKDSIHIARHHTNWRLKAIEESNSVTDQDLMYTSPLTISRKDFEKVKSEMLELIKKVSSRVQETEPEIVVCWNMDWIEILK